MLSESNSETAVELGQAETEFVDQRKPFYVDVSGRRMYAGCSDDRPLTIGSASSLDLIAPADTMSLREGYASVYGAAAGIAKNIMIAGVVQYGPDFIKETGGLDGLLIQVVRRMNGRNESGLIVAMHSAANNEDHSHKFSFIKDGPVGCAYGEGVAKTSGLLVAHDPTVRDVARADTARTFGDIRFFDEIINAHEQVLELATNGRGEDYAVSREKYRNLHDAGMPVMILEGKPHAPVKQTGLIANFELGKVRNSQAAAEAGLDFYSNDVAAVVRAILIDFKEYKLMPELLLRAFMIDATPVRAVLAASDADPELAGKLDPRNLKLGIHGDPQRAIAKLNQLVANQSRLDGSSGGSRSHSTDSLFDDSAKPALV